MCQHLNLDTDDSVIPRIAFGFGGGIGNTGAVCGAVTGAVMGIGLARSPGGTMDEVLDDLSIVADFRRRFEDEMGSISCRELTGADLTTDEGIEQYMASDAPQRVCFPAVATAYRLVVDMLEANR